MLRLRFRTNVLLYFLFACVTASAQTAYQFTTLVGPSSGAGYIDAVGTAARFNVPTGVAVDSAGNIYVADAGNHVLRKIATDGTVTTLAGSVLASGNIDGVAGAARFGGLGQLALDSNGNIIAPDWGNRSIRRITLAGAVSTLAGGPSNGRVDGPASSSNVGFSDPRGVAVDSTGNVYIADGYNEKIRAVLPSGVVTTVAGSGIPGSSDGAALSARFQLPWSLAFDASGNLYVADQANHIIRKITPTGVVSTYAGIAGSMGSTDGPAATARFNSPAGIVVDTSSNLFVTDEGNHTIRKIDVNGNVSTLAGYAGQYGETDGTGAAARFCRPTGIAFDNVGNLIVADTGNNAIRRVTPAGGVTTIAGSAPSPGKSAPKFPELGDIVALPSGDLVASDFTANTISRIAPDGTVTIIAGSAGIAGHVDGPGASATFNNPSGLAADVSGNVYIADSGNNLIRKLGPDGTVTTFAGQSGTPFSHPTSVAVDLAGNVFVRDSDARVCKITSTGAVLTVAQAGVSGFDFPTGVATSPSGELIVNDDSSRLLRIEPDGTILPFAGTMWEMGTRDGPVSTATFSSIGPIACDAAGNIFVGDAGRIREITTAGMVITVGGTTQYGVVDGVGAYARFNPAIGIAIDASGILYIADRYSGIIRKGVVTSAVAPPFLTNTLSPQKLTAGSTLTLQIVAAGTNPTYQWTRNGVPISGATQATLSIPNVSASDEGQYAVTVSNSVDSTTSAAVMVSVFTPSVPSFTLRHSAGGGAMLWGIAQGNGDIVTVGANGTILSSTDGQTWTHQNSGTTDWLVGVTFGAGQFVAVGDKGDILTSTDAVTWTKVASSGTTNRLNNIIYGAGWFVAVGEGGTILTSSDAKTWTPRASGVTTWLRGLAFNAQDNSFAISGQSGVILTSSDGITWSRNPKLTTSVDLEATIAVTSHATFASVGQNGAAVAITDGAFAMYGVRSNWWSATQSAANSTVRFRGLAQAGNGIFATGENGTIVAAPDTSGPWAQISTGTTANLVAGLYVGNTLYVVGDNETILASDPLYNSRLMNVSTRGQVSPGAPMIAGFVINGTASKTILLRADGPGLGKLGVPGTLTAPMLTLYDNSQKSIATNSGWTTATNAADIATDAAAVGAFPFAANSKDSALLIALPPGAYTAQVTSATESGAAMVEAYDVDPLSAGAAKAVNLSTRGYVGPDASPFIAGFVISGTASRRVLIRGVGPSLAPFGVPNCLVAPQLQLFDARNQLQQSAGAWSTRIDAPDIRAAATLANTFQLQDGSSDSAMIATLAPGNWTVQVTGANNSSGNVLVEVYDLP